VCATASAGMKRMIYDSLSFVNTKNDKLEFLPVEKLVNAVIVEGKLIVDAMSFSARAFVVG